MKDLDEYILMVVLTLLLNMFLQILCLIYTEKYGSERVEYSITQNIILTFSACLCCALSLIILRLLSIACKRKESIQVSPVTFKSNLSNVTCYLHLHPSPPHH